MSAAEAERAKFLDLAQQWRDLAERIEHLDRIRTPNGHPRP